MNILIVLNKLKNADEFYEKHNLLLENAKNWSSRDNDIYILSNVKNLSKTFSGINLVKPPSYLTNILLVSVWFSMVNHPRFDFVIEENTFTPFIYRKSEKVQYITNLPTVMKKAFNFDIRRIIKSVLIKTLYKKSYFLTPSWKVVDFLHSLGIKQEKVFLFTKGIELESKSRKKFKTGKNLLFIGLESDENIKKAINIIKALERRDLEWKITLLVTIDSIEKTKSYIHENDMLSSIKVIKDTGVSSFTRELKKSNFLFDLTSDDKTLMLDLIAFSQYIPVIVFDNEFLQKHSDITKVFFVNKSEDFYSAAQSILGFSKELQKNQKKLDLGQEFAKGYTWKNLAEKSLEFLNTMRL